MLRFYPKRHMSFIFLLASLITVGQYGSFPESNFSFASSAKHVSTRAKSLTGQKVRYNSLIHESSPYLLQHATNPVKWYPWGEEAFETAKKEDKPIFLSIGYSTCHWCHVMEHESFSDKEVADLLNTYFISIKVDREERPDIDQVYMTVTQALTGSGGWPMTIIMTPDKKPFFAGTYFPKNSRFDRSGLMELLPKIAEMWKNDRAKVFAGADQITRHVISLSNRPPGTNLGRQILERAQTSLAQGYDRQNGGFSQAPKFPSPHQLQFLLRRYYHTQNRQPLKMVEKTLTRMRLGGIYDHVGFGFHRYSTDSKWLVPHFEKMLYDQALLIMAYTEAYQVTGKAFYARVAREIITYVLRDMTSAEGGFFSAEDADSEGVEGKFYLWTYQELQKILGEKDAELFSKTFNVRKGGNFQSEEAGRHIGENILHLKKTLSELAGEPGLSVSRLYRNLEHSRKKLFRAREKRVHPFKDDKILTDWNGLMIAALAKAGRVLNEKVYIAAAEKAAKFILQNLSDDKGRLLKSFRRGKAGLNALLNDYAFMIWGLLELYEATFKTGFLEKAILLNDLMIGSFWDDQNGGFYVAADDSEKLLVRSKEIYDGAIPSGNSVAAFNLLRLAHMTGKDSYLERAEQIIKSFSDSVREYPIGHSQLMIALEFALNPNYEVVIVGNRRRKDTISMLDALRKPFLPEKVVLFRPSDRKASADIGIISPFTGPMSAKNDRATAYVCQGFTCKLPTTSVDQMLKNLGAD
ncbi:MAG: thioredoxin domain-containing protein [Desulfobacterales bacterium]